MKEFYMEGPIIVDTVGELVKYLRKVANDVEAGRKSGMLLGPKNEKGKCWRLVDFEALESGGTEKTEVIEDEDWILTVTRGNGRDACN